MVQTRILVVDDEPEITEMLARHFKLLGYLVETAANGSLATEVLERKKVDIVITDIMMPVMDGIHLLEHIRKEAPMIKTIVITGYVTLENALGAMRAGADTCIFKPLEDLTELDDAVSKAEAVLSNWRQKLRELRGMKPSS